jgi:asparagine synthase (glutamine-hydrolysing)
MSHRGPDGYGEWWSADGCVGFGHRRLAVIDLTAAGKQPMADASDSMHIVFNGEIYNHLDLRAQLVGKGYEFRSHTDTEVVLAAYREWGSDCLERLNGMFAFALYDAARRRLFMARDRAGEKPLFYALTPTALRFSSELKGLLADRDFPRAIDREALDCYLMMGFIPGERCILRGVRKLPPAHALVFDLESAACRVWRYWTLPETAAQGADALQMSSSSCWRTRYAGSWWRMSRSVSFSAAEWTRAWLQPSRRGLPAASGPSPCVSRVTVASTKPSTPA